MMKLTKWLIICSCLLSGSLLAQNPITSLSLETAYQLARTNYPLIQQKDLIKRASFLTIENINTAYLPQISLNGQATYQSDLTSIPNPATGTVFTPLSKDQFKYWGELNQLIYDGGVVKKQKGLQELSGLVDDQKLEVELYKLKDRINQLYLGILLLESQLSQANLQKDNIQIGLNTVKAQLTNGTVFKSAVLVVEAQLLQTEQRVVELSANHLALIRVMELFINQSISDKVSLERPRVTATLDPAILRPEMKLYTYQDSFWRQQNQMVSARSNPKLSLFAQGGYARPGLDLFKNEFAFYGIGGIRVNWLLSNLYTNKREHQIVALNQKMNEVQKDLFVFNTKTQLTQQMEEINKLKSIARIDEKIVDVRVQITAAAKAQLQHGVINSNDYLREINAEDQTKNQSILHQIQLLQAQINYQTIKGNQ